jgi:hypothetical protein
VYHVDLRSGVHAARAFNLSAAELETRFLAPVRAGLVFNYEDRDWDPAETKVTVIEADRLRTDQIGMGRGWANAEKRGRDVTAEVLASPPAAVAPARPNGVDQLKERLIGRLSAGPVPLAQAVTMAGELGPGHRVSEQFAVAELAVWELLHQAEAGLEADDGLAGRDAWERLLLSADTWLAGRVQLVPPSVLA